MRKLWASAWACKVLMAVTGVAMIGFLVAHLAGNLLIFMGPQALDGYASSLRTYPPLLWGLRLGLLGAVILHIISAIRLYILEKKAAGPGKSTRQRSRAATLASRWMNFSGLVVLFFILYHLAHLTFRWTHPEYLSWGPFEVHRMLMSSFQSPLLLGLYTIGTLCVVWHLSHGINSFLQTLGIYQDRWRKFLHYLGPVLGISLGLGFLSVPVSIYLGWLN